jgi:hypothetical protein
MDCDPNGYTPQFFPAKQCQLMCSVTVVEWLNVPLLPLMVSVAFVPETAPLPTLTVNAEDPGLPAGFGLNLALV